MQFRKKLYVISEFNLCKFGKIKIRIKKLKFKQINYFKIKN